MLKSILGDFGTFLEITNLKFDDSKKLWQNYRQILSTIYFSTFLVYGFVAIYYSGFQNALDGSAFLNVIGLITSITQIFALTNRVKINQMLDIFREFQKQHKNKWEKEMFQKESNMIWNLVYYYSIGIISYQICYQILPIVADSIVGYVNPDFPSLRVPLVAQGFIDFTEPRSVKNFLVSLQSVIWCVIGLCAHVGGHSLILVSTTYLKAELKILKQKLLLIKDHYNIHGTNNKYITKRLLKDAVIRHQLILKALDILNNAIGFPILVSNLISSICICLNLYGILAFEGNTSTAAKFQGAYANILITFILFWSCSLGESLEDENNEIFNCIYDLPWYDEQIEIRMTLNLMLRQTRKQFVLNYHQRSNLNCQTFMQMINTSYSYFTMLQSTVN